jgi:hypothetical protein
MNKYACQSNIHLTKLHDGPCDYLEQQQQLEGNRISLTLGLNVRQSILFILVLLSNSLKRKKIIFF